MGNNRTIYGLTTLFETIKHSKSIEEDTDAVCDAIIGTYESMSILDAEQLGLASLEDDVETSMEDVIEDDEDDIEIDGKTLEQLEDMIPEYEDDEMLPHAESVILEALENLIDG